MDSGRRAGHAGPAVGESGPAAGNGTAAGIAVIRCALALAVVIGGVLAYWASVTGEQSELPGISAALRVESWSDRGTPPEVVLAGLAQVAREEGESIIVEIPSPAGRTAFGAGGRFDGWIEDGFRGLPGSTQVEARDLAELPHGDYRQVLELTGGPGFAARVRDALDRQEIAFQPMVSQEWTFLLGGTALGKLVGLLIVFCLALCLIGVILGAHADAVRRLHGFGVWRSTAYVLARAGRGAVSVFLALAGLLTVGCALGTNIASATQLARYEVVFIGGSLVFCVLTLAAGIFGMRLGPVVAALGGKLPGPPVLVGVFMARTAACVAVAAMFIGAVNYSSEWRLQDRERQVWDSAGEAYALTLSGARGLEELAESRQQLSGRVRDLSAQGRLLFHQLFDPGMVPASRLDRDAMVYNDEALRRSLVGPARDAYTDLRARNAGPLVLVPEGLAETADPNPLLESILGGRESATARYPVGGTRARTWEVGVNEWMNRAETADPVVIVIPNDDLGIPDRTLVAALTQKDATLTDYSDFQSLQADPQVGSFIHSASLMSSEWAKHHQTMGRITWVYLGGVVAALLLSVVAAAAAWSSVVKVFHQRLRASYVQGVVPARLVGLLGAAECAVLGIVALYLWNRGAPARAWSEGPLAGSVDPSMLAMFSVPGLAWWVGLGVAAATSLPVCAALLRRRTIDQLIHLRR